MSRLPITCLLVSLGLWTGSNLAAEPTSSPLQEAGPIALQLFSPLSTKQSGISFVNPIDTEHPLKRILSRGVRMRWRGAGGPQW